MDFQTGGPVAFDSKQPVMLQWSAARTAKSYVITIRRLNPDGADTAATIVAVLRTADTSLAIPASVFHDGGFFVLTLSATLASADDGADPLFTSEAPDELSTTISGRFRLSASCGNGFTEAGEDCDLAGSSIICNSDCTRPVCGDGVVNPAADEACDTVDDTPGCDSDCTLPVCGDGHLNAFVEECDDGNTVNDGNGCGPNCKHTTCGNGTIEPGEFCDDGNLANLDGCSSTCETEVHEVEPNEDGTPSVSPFQQDFLGNDFASASADANGAFARTTTILAQIAPAGDEDVFAIDNPFADDRALLRAALRDPGTGPAVTCSFVPLLLFRDAAGTILDGVAHFDGGDCMVVDFVLAHGQRIYVQVLDYYDDGDTFAYALQLRLGRVVDR